MGCYAETRYGRTVPICRTGVSRGSGVGHQGLGHGDKLAAQRRRPNDGVLQLVLRRVGARTVVQDCYYRVPLQVLRPVYLDNTGTAYVYLLNPGGGVLGGDTYTITVTVEAGAHAYLTTPSATRLYAAPGAATRQHVEFTLHAGAVLTYLPEQTIPFANAAFQQHMTIRLGPGACVFLGDIIAPGRLARGERFAYREYCTSLHIENAQGRMILLERMRLQPQYQSLDGLGLLEGYTYLGTFYALHEGALLPATLADHLHDLLTCQRRLIGSATLLEHGGLAVRLLGEDHSSTCQALYSIWDTLRRHVLGYPAVSHRT
jgi:urease accessory protein